MEKALEPLRVLSTASLMNGSGNKCHKICVAFVLTVVVGSVVARQVIESLFNKKSIIIASVDYAHYNFKIPTVICCLIVTNRKKNIVLNFITVVTELEKKFKIFDHCPNDYKIIKKLSYRLAIYVLAKLILQQIPFFFQENNWETIRLLDSIAFNIPLCLLHVLAAQWITYLSILRLNFKNLTTVLKNKTRNRNKCWITDDFRNSKLLPPCDVIRSCGVIYDQLCIQGERVNDAFACQFLSAIPTIFLTVIFCSFQGCRMLKKQTNFDSGCLIFDVLYFLLFFEIVAPCVGVRGEMENFADALQKIDDDAVNTVILQVHHQKIEFTACGVFPLNESLIYSVIGAVTTYLVILLQFDL